MIFSCVFVTFLCGVLGQVWYLIMLIPDICPFPYLDFCHSKLKLSIVKLCCSKSEVNSTFGSLYTICIIMICKHIRMYVSVNTYTHVPVSI